MTCAQGLLRLLWGGPEVGVLRDCIPAPWRSGESVRIAVGRPEAYSISRVITKDLKNWYSQLPCLALSIKKEIV